MSREHDLATVSPVSLTHRSPRVVMTSGSYSEYIRRAATQGREELMLPAAALAFESGGDRGLSFDFFDGRP